jgi:hypothetical protein
MSGIVSGIDYNMLFSPGGSSDPATSILTALYSTTPSSASTFASTGDPLLDLKLAQQNQTADVALEAKQPQIQQAITAFSTAVGKATTIQAALGNPNIQNILLTASGLSKYIGETGLVQKAFMSDPADPKSVVNQLGDSTLLKTVQTYNFAKNGLAELKKPAILSTLTNGYAEVMWRKSLDQATPGLSNAITFLSQAKSIKSVYDILSDSTNFYVITGALNIPVDIVYQDQTAQVAALNAHVNLAKLQDPKYVASLTDQYLLSQQANNPSGSGGGTDLTSLAVANSGLVA